MKVLLNNGVNYTALGALIARFRALTTTFTYPDFTSVAGLNLVGSAHQQDSDLRLTNNSTWQRGAAWFTQKQSIQDGFETTFTFWISNDGADGFAFNLRY